MAIDNLIAQAKNSEPRNPQKNNIAVNIKRIFTVMMAWVHVEILLQKELMFMDTWKEHGELS